MYVVSSVSISTDFGSVFEGKGQKETQLLSDGCPETYFHINK